MRHLAFLREGLALAHAEAVLLICYHKSQPVIDHLLLDQCVSTDDDICLVIRNSLICFPLLRCRHRAGQQLNLKRNLPALIHFPEGLRVLPCQNFCRSHQRTLPAVLRSLSQRQHRQNRLAGANVTLNQAIH